MAKGRTKVNKPKSRRKKDVSSSSEIDEFVFNETEMMEDEWTPERAIGSLGDDPPMLLRPTTAGRALGIQTAAERLKSLANLDTSKHVVNKKTTSLKKRKRTPSPDPATSTLQPLKSQVALPNTLPSTTGNGSAQMSGKKSGTSSDEPLVQGVWTFTPTVPPKQKPKTLRMSPLREESSTDTDMETSAVTTDGSNRSPTPSPRRLPKTRPTVKSRLGYTTSKNRTRRASTPRRRRSKTPPRKIQQRRELSPTRGSSPPRANVDKHRRSRDRVSSRHTTSRRRRSRSRSRTRSNRHGKTSRRTRSRSTESTRRHRHRHGKENRQRHTSPSPTNGGRVKKHARTRPTAASVLRDGSDRPRDSLGNGGTAPTPDPATRGERLLALLEQTGIDNKTTQGKDKQIYPHSYVRRGAKNTRIGLGESSKDEYYLALDRMATDPAVPQAWHGPIRAHVREVLTFALKKDWDTVRLWSENVFVALYNGDLQSWDDHLHMLRMQFDAVEEERDRVKAKRWRPVESKPDNKGPFDRVSEQPCYSWNEGKCSQPEPHLHKDILLRHICAKCANKWGRTGLHTESMCDGKNMENKKKDF